MGKSAVDVHWPIKAIEMNGLVNSRAEWGPSALVFGMLAKLMLTSWESGNLRSWRCQAQHVVSRGTAVGSGLGRVTIRGLRPTRYEYV